MLVSSGPRGVGRTPDAKLQPEFNGLVVRIERKGSSRKREEPFVSVPASPGLDSDGLCLQMNQSVVPIVLRIVPPAPTAVPVYAFVKETP